MGIVLTKLFNQKNNQRILMVGLDGAGKTTLLYKLKLGEVQQTISNMVLVLMLKKFNIKRFVLQYGI